MRKTTSSKIKAFLLAVAITSFIIAAGLIAGCASVPPRFEVFHVAGTAYSVVTKDGRALAPGTYLVGIDAATGSAVVYLRDGSSFSASVVPVPGQSGQARFSVTPAPDGKLVVTQL